MKWMLDFKKRWMECPVIESVEERKDLLEKFLQESARQGCLRHLQLVPQMSLAMATATCMAWEVAYVHLGIDFGSLSSRFSAARV